MARFFGMQLFVLGTVVRPIVEAFVGCQLDPIDEFDVGALVDLGGVAGGKVGNEKTHRSAGLGRQRLPSRR